MHLWATSRSREQYSPQQTLAGKERLPAARQHESSADDDAATPRPTSPPCDGLSRDGDEGAERPVIHCPPMKLRLHPAVLHERRQARGVVGEHRLQPVEAIADRVVRPPGQSLRQFVPLVPQLGHALQDGRVLRASPAHALGLRALRAAARLALAPDRRRRRRAHLGRARASGLLLRLFPSLVSLQPIPPVAHGIIGATRQLRGDATPAAAVDLHAGDDDVVLRGGPLLSLRAVPLEVRTSHFHLRGRSAAGTGLFAPLESRARGLWQVGGVHDVLPGAVVRQHREDLLVVELVHGGGDLLR
mmetsp:Transcript_36069/g.87640  ORF Transcript_36069/g.87640 Transcript_36069/m.87640 type:complete len:302 (+) Transcript_36069:252-1157(+)